jgi:acyl carrier protein
MNNSETMVAAIYRAIDWINEELPVDRKIIKAPETKLLGPESVLDSMRLVTLIVTTEREIQEAFGVALTLADERALSMKESPFRSVQSLSLLRCPSLTPMRKNKVVLITGTRKGICLSLSTTPVWYQVSGAADRRSKGNSRITALPPRCRDEGAVKQQFSDIRKQEGQLDVLISNAKRRVNEPFLHPSQR